MVKFTDLFLETLKARVDLVALVQQSVPLKKRGKEYVACCPFHSEKTPSFTVSNEKDFYHCFGCGAHGNAFDFLMHKENIGFPEAVERLASQFGVPLPKEESLRENKEEISLLKELLSIQEEASAFFEKTLSSSLGEPARSYLKERSIKEEMQKNFRLGFAPSNRATLYTYLKDKNYSDRALKESGLFIFPENPSEKPFDKFRGRLMFPICNSHGQPIAFGGRLLGPGEPKYLNSPETPLFRKGHELYNFSAARKNTSKELPWIVVEGYIDVIRLVQEGYPLVVAPLGTALTEHQIFKIWRFCPVPVVCFDGDTAGKTAAKRAAKRILPFLKPGHSLLFLSLLEGYDPDRFVALKGMPLFKNLALQQSIPLVQVIWSHLVQKANLKTPEGKAQTKSEINEVVQEIQDPMVRDFYYRDLIRRFFEAQKPEKFPKGPQNLSKPIFDEFLKEKILLAFLIHYPFLIEDFEEALVSVELNHDLLSQLKKDLLDYYHRGDSLETLSLNTYLTCIGKESVLKHLSTDPVLMHVFSLKQKDNEGIRKECAHILYLLGKERGGSEDLNRARASLNEKWDDSAWKRFRELKENLNKNN